ncbi:4208_t:CDS:2, partial [Acaulospora colombiana]
IPDPGARKDTVKWIRGEIEQSSGLTETDMIEQQLSYLQRLMKQVLPGFELAARTRKQKEPLPNG